MSAEHAGTRKWKAKYSKNVNTKVDNYQIECCFNCFVIAIYFLSESIRVLSVIVFKNFIESIAKITV